MLLGIAPVSDAPHVALMTSESHCATCTALMACESIGVLQVLMIHDEGIDPGYGIFNVYVRGGEITRLHLEKLFGIFVRKSGISKSV